MAQSYVPDGDVLQELDLKKVAGKVIRKTKEFINKPIIAPTITKDQHLQKIRKSGGDTTHWEAFSGNAAQQAAIADAKKKKKEDDMVAKKLKKEGTSYGIYKGDGKPKGPMAKFADAKKKKKQTVKEVLGGVPGDGYIGHPNLDIKNPFAKKQIKKEVMPGSKGGGLLNKQAGRMGDYGMQIQKLLNQSYEPVTEDMKGMSQKSGDKRSTESGAGMTAKGVAKYNRRTGGNLKTAVTTPPSKLKPGSKAANRRKSFCARSKSWDGPRGKAARRRWNCEYEPELPMIPEEKKKDKALELVKKSIIAKYGKGAIMKRGQPKKVRGAKSTAGTGKYKRMADEKKQLKKDAKEMGYGSDTKGYVETRARYGSKENMKKGKGLGT